MQVIDKLEDLDKIQQPLHLALGVFDGVHLGHQAVITAAVKAAREVGGISGVLTFEPHPIQVLAPQRAPKRILASLHHKRELLEKLDVDVLIVIPFDQAFAQVTADAFLQQLHQGLLDLRTLTMGEDWKFGHKRGGDLSVLKHFGEAHGVKVEAIPAVMNQGERISSTRIRQALRDGKIDAAADMLGRPYTVLGTVVEGRQLGRTIGFPTANLKVHNEQLPCDGVWAVKVSLNDGLEYCGAANLGLRPTVEGAEAKRMLEVHLLNFEGDLYGSDIEVRFLRYVRCEEKFDSLDELKARIHEDVKVCQEACLG